MMEFWQERSTFQTTSQRLADQVRTTMKTGWFSDQELLEIHQKNTETKQEHCAQAHQVGSNENNPKKKNRKPRQMKHYTPKRYTTKQPRNTITKTKGKPRKCKENHE